MASHISAVNISYECLGGDTYLITVNLFRDCQELNPLPASLNVFINSSCNSPGYTAFPQISLSDVSQLCPDELPNSKCNGGNLPGTQLGVYQVEMELEPCSDWSIVVSEQNRDNATLNLVDPASYSIHVEAGLDNSGGICNSSPQLSTLNLPYTCVGTPLYYNLGFSDPDGDSLSYALVPAQASVTPNAPFDLNYLPAYSGAEPIPGMTIDPLTGQIEVTPATIGKFNTVVEVSEYRNGNLIGQVAYDFLFLVNVCAIPPPEPVPGSIAHVSGGAYPLDDNTVGVCAGDDFCFEIDFASTVSSINVEPFSNIAELIPGATETVSGTNPATITFCGTLPPDFAGGSFLVTAFDDACPVYGQAYYAIDFAIRQPLQASNDTVICFGESAQLSAINDTVYTWHTLPGNGSPPAGEISCNPCSNPEVTPDTTTTYIVTGQYVSSTCPNTDTVVVDIPLSADFTTADESCTGSDGVIQIDILTGSGNYDVVWSDIGSGSLLRDDLTAGSYSVTITDNVYGCSRTETFDLIQWDPPTANAGSDFEVCGLSANLEAIPSYGNPLWTGSAGVSFSDNTAPQSEVSVPSEGTYPLVWTEDAGIGCLETDTVLVTFYAQPTAAILAEDSVCGLGVQLESAASVGTPQWLSDGNLDIDDPAASLTTASAANFGLHPAILEIQNGLCTDRDTLEILFIEQPVSDAGAAIEVCGLTGALAASDGVGNGVWSLPPELSSPSDLSNETLDVEASTYGLYEVIRVLTNQGYCLSSDTTTIRFTEQPQANLGSDISVCDSTATVSFTLPAGSLSWELSGGLQPVSTVASPQDFSGSYGSHQAIIHADNGYGCTDTDTLELNFVVQPSLDPVLADTICGLSYVLDAETVAEVHYWLPPPNTTFSDVDDPSAEVTVNSEGQYYFPWVAANGNSCRDTVLVPVLFYEQPVADAGDDIVYCGLTTQLNASLSAGNFLWTDLPGLTFANATSPGSGLSADWYGTYTITAHESNGICTDSDEVSVSFISTPEIQNPQWECTGTDAEFVLSFGVSLGDTANYAIQGLNGTLSDYVFTSEALPSNTPVEVILEDFGYCGGDTLSGTQFCPVLTDAGQMNPDTIRLCGNDWVDLENASNPSLDGNDTLLYAFHDGAPTTLGTVFEWSDEPSFAFEAGLTYDATYYISAVAGNATELGVDLDDPLLSVAAGTPVEFYQPPQSEIGGDFTVCPYDTVWIPVDMEGAMPQELTYEMGGTTYSQWIDSDGFEIAATDSGDVNLIATHSEFCTGNVLGSARIDYYAIPSAGIATDAEICEGDTAAIAISFSGAAPFEAVLTQNGNAIETINTMSDSLEFSTTSGGDFMLIEISDQNCVNPDFLDAHLTVNPLPEVDAGPNQDLCDGDTVLIGAPAMPGQTYAWSNPGGLLTTDEAQVYYAAEINSPFPQSAQLTLSAGLNGCFESDSITLTTYPTPVPQIVGDSTVCSGDSLSLIGFGGENYAWQPASYFGHPNQIQSLFAAPADTEVQLTVISEAGCTAMLQRNIEVLPTPDSLFAVSQTQGCAPFTLSLNAFSDNPGDHYQWTVSGHSGLPDAAYIETELREPGLYDIVLEVTAANGCKASMSWPENIEATSTFAAFTSFPEKPDITNPELYFRNQSPFGVSSSWTFDTLNTAQGRDARYTFPPYVDGEYEVCLTVTDSNSCEAVTCKTIKIRGKRFVYVPSAFTPNGDGLNDLFYPVLTHVDVAEYHFWITNSRGLVVFDSRDPQDKWNGTINGSTFYGENRIFNWFLVVKPNFNVETQYLEGSVTLIR